MAESFKFRIALVTGDYVMVKQEGKPLLPCIQCLRLIAAFGVMLSHVGFGDSYFTQIAFSAGVNLFFCISAFLMMYTTENKKPKNFIAKRLIRLVPLYWLLTIMTFVAASTVNGIIDDVPTIEELMKSLFFVPYVRDGIKTAGVIRPIVGPAWTLRFDVWFLFVFALSMKINHKIRGFISCIICMVFMVLGHILPVSPVTKTLEHEFWFNFIFGIVTYYIWVFIRDRINWQNGAKIIASIVLCIAIFILFSANKSIYFSILSAFIILLLSLLLMSEVHVPKCIMEFGKMSYSFYLTHYYVILILARFFDFDTFTVSTCIGTVIAIVLSLIVAYVSYQVIEKRFGDILKKFVLSGEKP